MKKIVVKIGTNLLTRHNGKLDYNLIDDLTDQIAQLHNIGHRVVLVSSGAVGAGRSVTTFDNEKDPTIKKQMLASIGQGRLYQAYSEYFNREHGIITAQTLYTRHEFREESSFSRIQTTLESLLKNRILPIANENDAVFSQEGSFGDNDQLSALTASLLSADILIILSDVDGLYTADPKRETNARFISAVNEITDEIRSYVQDTVSVGGTGGMVGKVQAAEIATRHGILTVLAGGRIPHVLRSVLSEESIGTSFSPQRKKSSLKETWLKTSARIESVLVIDDGAARALRSNKSLLAVGIIGCVGFFGEGSPVLIENKTIGRLGVGIARIDSNLLRDKLTSGDTRNRIVVHKDKLYLF